MLWYNTTPTNFSFKSIIGKTVKCYYNMNNEILTLLEYLAGPLVTRHDKSPKDKEGGIVNQTKRL